MGEAIHHRIPKRDSLHVEKWARAGCGEGPLRRSGLSSTLASMFRFFSFLVAVCLLGCKTPSPVEPVTEQPRGSGSVTNRSSTGELQTRNLPDLPRTFRRVFTNHNEMYRYYTNSQLDRLVEQPPALPGKGPIPLLVAPRVAISNWMTKAHVVQPKPLTNELGHVVLTRLTVTPNNGGPTFVASLEGEARPTVQADANVAVVIIPVNFTNYIIEASERMGGDTNWRVMSSGVVFNTNGHIVFIDVHGGTKPHQFFKQQPAP